MPILSLEKVFSGKLKGDDTDGIPISIIYTITKIDDHPSHINCKCIINTDVEGVQ